jgi:ribonuclease BN (tRNA processing enzyme)
VRVTVLGKSPSWQDAGGACSGYLVQHGRTTLLLDCGNGVFAKLRRHVDYAAVGAVVISHLHADHFLDLVPFAYALGHSPRAHAVRPALLAPGDASATFRRVCGGWGSEDLIEGAFALREYAPGDEVEVGELRVAFCAVSHHVPTHAVAICAAGGGGGRFVFSADTRPADALVDLARDADVLMCEATLGAGEPDAESGHLTATQAGEHAARAGVRRLVLTHLTDELDASAARRAAAAAFGGPVEIAHEGAVYAVT